MAEDDAIPELRSKRTYSHHARQAICLSRVATVNI